MKIRTASSISVIVSLLVCLVGTISVSANEEYFGFIEKDKGEGMWALVSIKAEGPGWSLDATSIAGLLAEFRRRHPDLKVLSAFSVLDPSHYRNRLSFVIFTEPRNQK